jgi:hypothetical protein
MGVTRDCGRDERLWGGSVPPASWHRFSPDRKGQHPKDHLANYQGWMHADGYAGFEDLYRSGSMHEVACMAHVRRKFVDIHKARGSAIAGEAIGRIAQLHAIEKEARGSPSDRRVNIRQTRAKPIFDNLEVWKSGWKSGCMPDCPASPANRRWRAQSVMP